ncbi:MAG: GNAT family N-acetyltransferase [Gammaproteobacteria bacterium]|nr:GNAT family N-acetyltransferase [Gammaproteobacteria bacterium]
MKQVCDIVEINTVAAFRDMRDEWSALLQRCPNSTPFLTWEWLYSWWEVFAGETNLLKIVTIRQQGRLIGLAPFQIEKRGRSSGGDILRFIGTGEDEADEVVSEYLDILAETGAREKVIESVLKWFDELQGWRRLLFENILPDSLIDAFCDALDQRFNQQTVTTGLRYSIPLSGGYDAYLDGIGQSRRKRLAQSERRLKKDGGQALSVCQSREDAESAFEILSRLNAERWETKSKPCIFDSEKFTTFHRKIIDRLLPLGQTDIHLLSLGDKPLAAVYCFYYNKAVYYYQSGFASEGANRYTPLWVAHSRIIERAADAGYELYDFMRGDEHSYKSDFGCQATEMRTRQVFRSTLDSWIMATKPRIRNNLKTLSNLFSSKKA